MPKLKRLALWTGWLILITAPFVWVGIQYDFHRRLTTAYFRQDRLQFLFGHLPHLLVTVAVAAGFWWVFRQRGVLRRQWVAAWWPRQNPGLQLTGFLLLLLLIPTLLFSDKYLDMAVFTCLYVILALGLNITVGLTGLLVLGYAAFFAIGAYTFAILQRDLGVPFWLALVPAAGVSAVFGFVLGLPSLRLRGDYLAIVTLGFGEAIRFFLKNLSNLTGGDFGIIIRRELKIPNVALPFGLTEVSRVQLAYLITFVFAILTIIVTHRLNHSRIGRAWIAIREDETAAAAMGINTVRLKILAFTISAVWAGIAGVLYAAYAGFVDPETFRFEESALILSMVVLGGMGSVPGVILGAVVLYIGPRLLRDQFPSFVDYRLLIFGMTMVLMMVFRPQGLIGSARRKIELRAAEETE